MHLVSYYNMFLLIGVHLRNVFQLNSNSSSVGLVCPSYRMMTQSLPYDISGSKQAHHSKSTNDCPYFNERECMSHIVALNTDVKTEPDTVTRTLDVLQEGTLFFVSSI